MQFIVSCHYFLTSKDHDIGKHCSQVLIGERGSQILSTGEGAGQILSTSGMSTWLYALY